MKASLYIHQKTDPAELARVINTHWDSIVSAKLASSDIYKLKLDQIMPILWNKTTYIGWWVLDSIKRGWKWNYDSNFDYIAEKFITHGIRGIEISSLHLWDWEMMRLVRKYFDFIVVEIGVKMSCDNVLNSPSMLNEWAVAAKKENALFVVAESWLNCEVGVFKKSWAPIILVLDELRETMGDPSRLIIEASRLEALTLLRTVLWEETIVWNIHDLSLLDTPFEIDDKGTDWSQLWPFRTRLQQICKEHQLSWDDVARNGALNLWIMKRLWELLDLSDEKLLTLTQGLLKK